MLLVSAVLLMRECSYSVSHVMQDTAESGGAYGPTAALRVMVHYQSLSHGREQGRTWPDSSPACAPVDGHRRVRHLTQAHDLTGRCALPWRCPGRSSHAW